MSEQVYEDIIFDSRRVIENEAVSVHTAISLRTYQDHMETFGIHHVWLVNDDMQLTYYLGTLYRYDEEVVECMANLVHGETSPFKAIVVNVQTNQIIDYIVRD